MPAFYAYDDNDTKYVRKQ